MRKEKMERLEMGIKSEKLDVTSESVLKMLGVLREKKNMTTVSRKLQMMLYNKNKGRGESYFIRFQGLSANSSNAKLN